MLPVPSEERFDLFTTFDHVRFSCSHFTLGGAVPFPRVPWSRDLLCFYQVLFPDRLPWVRLCCPCRAGIVEGLWNASKNLIINWLCYQFSFAPSPLWHDQQAEGLIYPSPMATPWEAMKQQSNGNALGNDETTSQWQRLGKTNKIWIAPQSFKSCMKIPNNLTALSHSSPVIARSAARNKIWMIIFCIPKQSQTQ